MELSLIQKMEILMMLQRKKRAKLPSDEQITLAKEELATYLEKVLAGEIRVGTEKETIVSKLRLIQEIIEPLKQPILDKKITYTTLSKVLEEQLHLQLSPQTLRSFCQNQLGFPKADKKSNPQPVKPKSKVSHETQSRDDAETTLSQDDLTFE